jgi:hypothetical protein
MALLYRRAGRLTAKNGGFRPGQMVDNTTTAASPSPDSDCCWSFKSDTSTDETDGHMYGLQVAYDHLAETAHEKLRVGRLICSMVAYIVENGFLFIDPLTGNRTTWGYWSPAILNGMGVGPRARPFPAMIVV